MTSDAMAYKICLYYSRRLYRDDEGAAAVEYGLIMAGIALAIVGAVFAIGEDLVPLFETVGSAISSGQAKAGN